MGTINLTMKNLAVYLLFTYLFTFWDLQVILDITFSLKPQVDTS